MLNINIVQWRPIFKTHHKHSFQKIDLLLEKSPILMSYSLLLPISFQNLRKIDLQRCWNPLILIDNILSESKEQHWITTMKNEQNEVFIVERRRLRGVFLETLELKDFPLDVQVRMLIALKSWFIANLFWIQCQSLLIFWKDAFFQ